MKVFYYIFLICIIVSCGSSGAEEKTDQRVIRPVKYMTVAGDALSHRHSYSGVTRASNESNLSFRVGGIITTLNVKVGQRVKKGQLLARVDPGDYSIQLRQAQSQLKGAEASAQSASTQIKSAEANYVSAKSNYERIERLYESNSVSLREFEQAKATFEASQASYEAAKTQYESSLSQTDVADESIRNAKNQVSYTYLRAPYDGVISNQHIELNELVSPGTPIYTVSSTGKPEISVGVPESVIALLADGQKVQVRFSTLKNKEMTGTISEVGYSLAGGSTYPITINLDDNDSALRPGMPADVGFHLDHDHTAETQIIIPAAAVGEDGTGHFVLLIDQEKDGIAVIKKSYVTLGTLIREGFIIEKGLTRGQRVAIAGLSILQDGDLVRL